MCFSATKFGSSIAMQEKGCIALLIVSAVLFSRVDSQGTIYIAISSYIIDNINTSAEVSIVY